MDEDKIPLLHVLPQSIPHDEAVIVGNLAGLLELKTALDLAIQRGSGVSRSVFCNDGEGYRVMVIATTNEKMKDVPFGYTDTWTWHSGPDWPDWLFREIDQLYESKP